MVEESAEEGTPLGDPGKKAPKVKSLLGAVYRSLRASQPSS